MSRSAESEEDMTQKCLFSLDGRRQFRRLPRRMQEEAERMIEREGWQ